LLIDNKLTIQKKKKKKEAKGLINKTAQRSDDLFRHDLILAKFIFFLINLAKIKSCLNGSLDCQAILSGPMAFDPIHLHKYFHICIYFIHQVITCFSKHAA